MVGRDVTREAVLSMFPDATQVPIIVLNNHRIAGTSELQLLLEKDQLKYF